MLGMFYNDGRISNDMSLYGNTAYGLPANFLKGLSTIYVNSFSVFGQLRWKPVEQLEFAGGARWTHEKRELTVFNRLTNASTVLAPGSDHIDSKNWSPEFTITWTPSDTLTIFGAFKQAYKSGSFNIVTPPGAGSDKHFGDEKAQGGEIGIKSRWLDRSLSVDLAGYYYRYKGLQTGVNQPSANGLPVLQTINAGKAEVYGLDFEMKYRPRSVEGLEMHLAANWNKTRFLELNNVPCWGGELISQGCNQFLNTSTGRYTSQDLTGVAFVRAPEWQMNFGADYEMPVGNGMKLAFGIDNKYSSSYLAVLGRREDFRRPSFLKTDLSLTLTGPKDRWEVALIGNNISNKITAGYCSPFDFSTGTTPQASIVGIPTAADRNAVGVAELGCSVGRGREVWLRLGFKL